jgi:hypothetical protein
MMQVHGHLEQGVSKRWGLVVCLILRIAVDLGELLISRGLFGACDKS